MRTFVLLFFLLPCSLSFAQNDIVDGIVHIKKLLSDFKSDEALSQIHYIEEQCLSSENDTLKAVFHKLKGQTLYFLGRYEECISSSKEAVLYFEQSNLRQYEYLDALRTIAHAYYRQKDYDNAEKYYRKGLLKSSAFNESTINQYKSDLYLNLGNLYKAKGDSVLAEECFKKLNPIDEKPTAIEELNYMEWEISFWEKINAFIQSDQYQEAVNMLFDLIKEIQEKRGKRYEYILAVYSQAMLLSRYLNRFDEALPLFEEVVNCGNNTSILNESVCGAYCNIALCYAYNGDFSKLEHFILDARKILNKANIDQYPPYSIYRFAGNGAYWTQNYEMAIKYYEQYLNSKNKRETGYSYEEITNQLSVSYILTDKPKLAKQLLVDFLKSDEKRLEKENQPALANIYHNLGRSYMLEGANSEALKYLNKSKVIQTQIWGDVAEKTRLYIEECMSK